MTPSTAAAEARIPRLKESDSTRAFLREGYLFVANRCSRLGTDAFRARLGLREAVCMRGLEPARQFYREGRFTRRGAMPTTVVRMLQDFTSVQMLDGPAHHHRKAMFLDIMRPEKVEEARQILAEEWRGAFERSAGDRIVLYEAVNSILTRMALRWCGLSVVASDAARRCEEYVAMIDASGRFGPAWVRAALLRRRNEAWARSVIESLRSGEQGHDGAAASIAAHRERSGDLLDVNVAAVELINVIRPIVAVSRFIVFAAHALHENPEEAERLRMHGEETDLRAFAQEVRRFYPFFPAIGGRVIEPFNWRGHRFDSGDWVILDLYGTDHDPEIWPDAERFLPDRFRDWNGDANSFVPQGGGDYLTNHRCPGEGLTIALTIEAIRLLLHSKFSVPEQDVSIPLDRMPTLPTSGFVIEIAAPSA